jgi:hypothetical protein
MEDETLSELCADTCVKLLHERYRLLLITQIVWLTATRVVFFAAVLLAAWMPRHGTRGLLVTAAGAVLYGLVGWYSQGAIERKRFKLEELFVEHLREDNPLTKIYVQWRYEDWKHSRHPRILTLEPILWIVLLIVALVT